MARKLTAPGPAPVAVPAVHANKGVEAWYRDKLYALIADMHSDLAQKLSLAWATNPPEIGFANDGLLMVELLATDASPTKEIAEVLKKWGKKWSRKLDKLSLDISLKFARKNFTVTDRQLQDAFAKAGFTVKFKPTKRSLEAYQAVAQENVGLIKSIPQQYLKDVQVQVWESVKKGADMQTLAEGLRKTYGITTRRAALIARDQNNKAKATIENTRRQQLGIDTAIWQHSGGGKEPRPAHVAMSGKPYKLTKGMWDTDEREFVWPGTLINCRCTSRAVIPGFEDA
jgi:SPP1 gp7 family putative phage head morphogenesis protein